MTNHYHGMPQTETKVTRREKTLRLPPDHTQTVVETGTQTSGGTSLEAANKRAPAASLEQIPGTALSPCIFISAHLICTIVTQVQHVYLRDNVAVGECARP